MGHKMCPVWIGYVIASPLRRLLHKPEEILAGLVQSGMRVLDIGPGMGFFSIPMARVVGPSGTVICVDRQEGMLAGVRKRAKKAGVSGQIQTLLCDERSFGIRNLAGTVDFALAFAVVHEVPDAAQLFAETAAALKPHGKMLVAEPRGHVSEEAFAKTVALAERCGLRIVGRPDIRRSQSVLLEKM